jgi:peptide-methionine (R)-S-oxide reductase
MTTRRRFLGDGMALAWASAGVGVLAGVAPHRAGARGKRPVAFEVTRPEAEWRTRLTPQQYYVLRQHGTERPGSSPLDKERTPGLYHCAGCDLPLFSSATKYDSGTGWPSFWAPLDHAVGTAEDRTLFMARTEVHCRRCGGHLGHVFEDGPRPTGLRYCMNGAALVFRRA